MHKPVEIKIIRAEGVAQLTNIEHIIKPTAGMPKDDLWEKANAQLQEMQLTMSGHGYDKIDFWIKYDDGETYKGRFDLEAKGKPDITEHIKGVTSEAAKEHPEFKKFKEEYEVGEGGKFDIKEWLNKEIF